MLYFLPHQSGDQYVNVILGDLLSDITVTCNYILLIGGVLMKCEVNFQLLREIKRDVCEQYPMIISNEFQAYAEHILLRFNLRIPETVEEATEAYFRIITFIETK